MSEAMVAKCSAPPSEPATGIFPVERDGADRSFDGVVVELDAAVVDEPGQAVPARQDVADCFGELALLTDQGECRQPQFKGLHERLAFCCRTARRSSALRPGFSRWRKAPDVFDRFAGDRRRTGGCQFVEAAPCVGPTEGEFLTAPALASVL